jgi:predicted nuclease with TOPRIM domain
LPRNLTKKEHCAIHTFLLIEMQLIERIAALKSETATILRERDERIEALEAENARLGEIFDKYEAQIERLSAPVTEDEASELAAEFHDGYGIRGTDALIAARKETAGRSQGNPQ